MSPQVQSDPAKVTLLLDLAKLAIFKTPRECRYNRCYILFLTESGDFSIRYKTQQASSDIGCCFRASDNPFSLICEELNPIVLDVPAADGVMDWAEEINISCHYAEGLRNGKIRSLVLYPTHSRDEKLEFVYMIESRRPLGLSKLWVSVRYRLIGALAYQIGLNLDESRSTIADFSDPDFSEFEPF